MIEPVSAVAIAKVAALKLESEILSNISQNLSRKISDNIQGIAKSIVDRTIVSLQIGFKDYLMTSYRRCRTFKTLLNPNLPLDLIDNYVHINLRCADKAITDDDLISHLDNHKFVIITGLAGSGKSMFMKYLTICKFNGTNVKTPLFVDLRNLNQITDTNLLAFIRNFCVSKSSNITSDQFELALRAGSITLILDGFDEINYEIRDIIQAQILDVSRKFPDATVIVSSRPDSRFGSWTSFYVYKVEKLSKLQCIALIRGLHYDKGVRNRFVVEIQKKLFESHESFLSSPLLATIMLLTYEEFAEIPDKMHTFYSLAFDTLFQKHDAQKEQFRRKTHTGFTREEFRVCFSSFSAMSYLEQNFSFTEERLLKTAERALKYARQTDSSIKNTVTAKQFIADLIGSVCMLHQDGLEVAFVHRSFQEYFAAVFATEAYGDKSAKILDKYALRFGDSVVSMALEMDRENVEQNWILPTIIHIEEVLFADLPLNYATCYSKLIGGIRFLIARKSILVEFNEVNLQMVGLVQVLKTSYPKNLKKFDFPGFFSLRVASMRSVFDHHPEDTNTNSQNLRKALNAEQEDDSKKAFFGDVMVMLEPEDDWWMRETGIRTMLDELEKNLVTIRNGIEKREKAKAKMLLPFFD